MLCETARGSRNWKNSVTQTAVVTIFAFSSVFILLLWLPSNVDKFCFSVDPGQVRHECPRCFLLRGVRVQCLVHLGAAHKETMMKSAVNNPDKNWILRFFAFKNPFKTSFFADQQNLKNVQFVAEWVPSLLRVHGWESSCFHYRKISGSYPVRIYSTLCEAQWTS